jgi:hypothetical protein
MATMGDRGNGLLENLTPRSRSRLNMKSTTLILLGTLLVGGALRSNGLGAKSLCFEEAIAASFLDFTSGEILQRSSEPQAIHPPLFYLALKAWALAWGDHDVALRSMSVLCGVATILGGFLMVIELGRLPEAAGGSVSVFSALLTAGLLALSPLHIHASRLACGYSLATALVVFSSWMLLRGLHRGGWHIWSLAGFLALAAVYTAYPVIPTIIAQGLFAFLYLWLKRRPGPTAPSGELGPTNVRSESASLFGLGLATAILTVGFVVPWTSVLITSMRTIRADDVYYPISWSRALDQFATTLGWTMHSPTPSTGPVVWLACPATATALAWLAVRGSWSGRFLALTGLLPVLTMVIFSVDSNRTLMLAKHLIYAQVSWLAGFALLIAGVRSGVERAVLATWVLGLSALACWAAWPIIGPSTQPGMRAAVAFVLSRHAPGELVVSPSPFMYFGIAHYTRGILRPRLLVAEPRRELQRGAEHLRNDQLITPEALAASGPQGVWVISSASYPTRFILDYSPPVHWEQLESRAFLQDFFIENPLSIQHYRDRRTARGRSVDANHHDK